MREVFQRQPFLDAFSLDDELWLCDLEVRSWPGCDWGDAVYSEISAAINELGTEVEYAGANELLRGRTFVRMLQ